MNRILLAGLCAGGILTVSLFAGCASSEHATRTDTTTVTQSAEPAAAGAPAPVETTTTQTSTQWGEVHRHENLGILGGAFQVIGTVLAFPFRAVATIIEVVF